MAIYMDGTGVKLDFNKAHHYFKLTADQGYLTAPNNLLHVSMILGKCDPAAMTADLIRNMQQ